MSFQHRDLALNHYFLHDLYGKSCIIKSKLHTLHLMKTDIHKKTHYKHSCVNDMTVTAYDTLDL